MNFGLQRASNWTVIFTHRTWILHFRNITAYTFGKKQDIGNWASAWEATRGLLHRLKTWTLVHKRLKIGQEFSPVLQKFCIFFAGLRTRTSDHSSTVSVCGSCIRCVLSGNLDLVGLKQVFKAENNPWVPPIEDQLQIGVSHVFDYIRTDTYKLWVFKLYSFNM